MPSPEDAYLPVSQSAGPFGEQEVEHLREAISFRRRAAAAWSNLGSSRWRESS